ILTIHADGTYTYTPDTDYFGTDSFSYEVCDGQGGCTTALVTITINSLDYDLDGISNQDEGDIDDIDTDGDGTPDYQDLDSDDDSILDEDEGNVDTDGDGISNFRDLDSDDDGIPDAVELDDDCDEDGIPNYLDKDICDVIVPKGISPNGDGDNDEWFIKGIEQYADNNVKVFNRWGNLVYERVGYNNAEAVWIGQSEGAMTLGGNEVTDGTYFYVIELGEGMKPLSGYVIVKR
ncbi:MAG: gliding motility-associated C-terminal domain-containing protein, partial [Cyclobacteriaceae bacterium]|nr:gliding motility-associated C-terminal domain-containing protein [Cyclobacteriaceae bacterium]